MKGGGEKGPADESQTADAHYDRVRVKWLGEMYYRGREGNAGLLSPVKLGGSPARKGHRAVGGRRPQSRAASIEWQREMPANASLQGDREVGAQAPIHGLGLDDGGVVGRDAELHRSVLRYGVESTAIPLGAGKAHPDRAVLRVCAHVPADVHEVHGAVRRPQLHAPGHAVDAERSVVCFEIQIEPAGGPEALAPVPGV